jgi:hypothetical protein
MLRRLPPTVLAALLLAPAVRGQAQASWRARAPEPATPASPTPTPTGVTLEVHGGYGSGGRHPDGLVGLGLSVSVGPDVEAGTFATAVIAQQGGETVFLGPELRVLLLRGAWRPYLAGGAMLIWRDYDDEHFGEFAAVGLEAKLDAAHRWAAFVEGRALASGALDGGSRWAQVIGGLRAMFGVR